MEVNAIFQEKINSAQGRISDRVSGLRLPGAVFAEKLTAVMGRVEGNGASMLSGIFGGAVSTELSQGELVQGTGSSSYDSIIASASAGTGLPQDLIRAVIQVESSFDANAVSAAGAEGLMQLMPGTAAELGVTDSFDPAQNIAGGALYLKQQLDRFGDIRLALAAYNIGPGKVSRLDVTDANDAGQYSAIPERVRNYVDRVLTAWTAYQSA